VLTAAGGYVAYATNHRGVNVQVRESPDLSTWEPRPDGLPALPAWAQPGWTWSPSVIERAGTFVLWYTVREPRSGRQAISTAVSDRPTGPFTDGSEGPALFQLDEGGSIDPSPFVDADGQAYLLWKADANALSRASSLWVQALSADGRALEGEATCLLVHDRGWERPLVEAPSLACLDGRYWLWYSGGWWASPTYGIGLAVADDVLGPYRKLSRHRPWAQSDGAGAGPGGQEVFRDAAGQLRLAYHAWEPHRVWYQAGGRRTLRIGHLDLAAGTPTLRP
jgi:beta-xylosidase